MRIKNSSTVHLLILITARITFDLDLQAITLYFTTFSEYFQLDVMIMGFLVSLFSISILFSPIFGNLSDQYGRRSFMTLGLLIFAFSSGLTAIAQDWLQVLIARALAGLSNAIFFPALLAEIGDQYSYDERTRAMGVVRLAWPIAFIVGVPLVGFSIEHISWRLPFVILAILALVTGLIINFIDYSEDESKTSNSRTIKSSLDLDLVKKVLLDRSAIAGLLLMLLAVGSIGGVFVFFPFWMEAQFQVGETSIGMIFSIMGIGTLVGTMLAALIGDIIGPKKCAVAGLLISAGCMILIPQFSFNIILVIILVISIGIAFDFAMTGLPALLTQLTPDAKGTILSLNQALNAGATAIGAALSGLILKNYGYSLVGFFFGSMTLIGALIGSFYIQVISDVNQKEITS